MLEFTDTRDAPQRLIFYVLLVFVLLNLFLPGESSALTLILSQVVIFGFTGLYLLYIRPRFSGTLWALPAVFFGLAILVSQYASMHGYGSMRTGLQLLSVVLLAWLVADVGVDRRSLLFSLSALVAIAAVLSAVGLLQVYTFFAQPVESSLAEQFLPVDSGYLSLVYSQKRIFSTFVLPTSFSMFLAMVFPVAASLAIQFRKRIFVLAACSVAMLLMAMAMLQAQSNGGPVSLALGCAATAIVFARDRRLSLRWIALAALLIGIVLIIGVGLIRGNFLWDLGARNSSVRLRWNLWMATLAMIGQHGLFGIGAGNFELAFMPFVRPDVRPTKFAHNTYLQIPLEFGVLGLIALIAVIALLLRAVLKRKDDNWEEPALRYGLVAAVAVFLIGNAIEIVLYFQSLGLLGAMLIGLLLRQQRTERFSESGEAKIRPKPWRVASAVVCGIALLLLGRWFLADHYYERASAQLTLEALEQAGDTNTEELIPSPPNDDLTKKQDISVEQFIRTAISIDSGNYRYHFLLADVLTREGEERNAEILSAYKQAVDLCPQLPYLHYNYGVALAQRGLLLQAAAEIAEAARLNPSNEEYQAARAVVEERFEALMREGRQ